RRAVLLARQLRERLLRLRLAELELAPLRGPDLEVEVRRLDRRLEVRLASLRRRVTRPELGQPTLELGQLLLPLRDVQRRRARRGRRHGRRRRLLCRQEPGDERPGES